MSEKRVPVLAPDPETGRLRFATVNESEAHIVEKAGGRRLSAKEALSEQQQATYDAKSTAEKVTGAVVGTAAGPIVGNALAGTGVITEAPQVQAFQQGEAAALTGGLDQVAVMKGLQAVAGKDAARAYGKNQLEIADANSGWKTAGELTGFAATALAGAPGGAARALPGVGIQALGGLAERGAARALGGVAARGAMGRAVATAGELGVRGGVEASLYGAASATTEAVLGDPDVTADKVFAAAGMGALHAAPLGFAGGAVLGGSGSLTKSAVGGTINAARGGLARAMGRAEQAATDVVADEGKALAKVGAEAAEAAPKAGAVTDVLRDPDAATRKLSNNLAFDALNATKVQARKAIAHVEGGSEAVGEYVNRVALKPMADGSGTIGGSIKAGMGGRADELLDVIKADKYGRVAEGLSSSIKGSGARMGVDDIRAGIETTYQAMLKDPTKIAGAESFKNRIVTELSALENAGKVAADRTVDATDMFYTRAALEKQAYEVTKSSGAAGEAYKGFLRDLDGKIVSAIDDAAAKAGESGRRDAIRHWKREWQLASAAERAAEGGAERVAHNNVFGIREAIGGLAGIATGHPLLGVATLVGGKIAKERGAAAAATLLGRAADMGLLSRAIKTINGQMDAASKGLLAPAKRARLPETPIGTARERATAAQRQVAEWQANPQGFVDKVAEKTEALNVNAPELAGALTRRMTDAFAFMASKMPTAPPPDPFNPRAAPRLTDGEAAKLARYAWYVEKPARFFDELAHGKLTFEGLEVAQALMPGAFAELQQRTAEGLATLASQGRQPPFQQRQALGALLGFPATPAQRPEHAQFLQANVLRSLESAQSGSAPRPASSKPTQRSALDRLESGGPGR